MIFKIICIQLTMSSRIFKIIINAKKTVVKTLLSKASKVMYNIEIICLQKKECICVRRHLTHNTNQWISNKIRQITTIRKHLDIKDNIRIFNTEWKEKIGLYN